MVRPEQDVVKPDRTPIDDEIEALENARKEAVAERNRLIKNNSERNGHFGDTKEVKPDDIFAGEGFDPSASQPLVDKQNHLIETLEGKFTKLKQSKETGIKENAGQLAITDKEIQDNQSKPESRFKPPKETTDTTPEIKPQDEFGKNNKLFTEEAALAAIARLKASLGNLNAGFNPQTAFDALQVGGYLIEEGARKFADYAKKMVELIGDAIKPYLKMSYMSVMKYPGMERFEKEIDSYDYVTNFNLEEINKENVSDSKKDLVDSQNDTESKNTQKPKDNDTRGGTQTKDPGLGREKRPEIGEPDTQGVDRGSKVDIRPNGVGSGSVSGSSNSTEKRKGKRRLKMIVEAMWGYPSKDPRMG